jgi:Zn-finger nucleic acid-binding protein
VQFSQALADKGRLDVSESARIIGEATARLAPRGYVDTSPDGLPCVVCGNPMRREHLERAGFDLDICDDHGMWFDRGELPAVAHLCGARAPTTNPEELNYAEGLSSESNSVGAGAIVLGIIAAILDAA